MVIVCCGLVGPTRVPSGDWKPCPLPAPGGEPGNPGGKPLDGPTGGVGVAAEIASGQQRRASTSTPTRRLTAPRPRSIFAINFLPPHTSVYQRRHSSIRPALCHVMPAGREYPPRDLSRHGKRTRRKCRGDSVLLASPLRGEDGGGACGGRCPSGRGRNLRGLPCVIEDAGGAPAAGTHSARVLYIFSAR